MCFKITQFSHCYKNSTKYVSGTKYSPEIIKKVMAFQ